MDWKNTPKGVKAKVEKADKKAKSGGDPHGRTTKEKVKDAIKGTGLSTKGKKIRDAIVIGPSTLIPGLKSKEFYKSVGKKAKDIAGSFIKKAHAKPKSDLSSPGTRKKYPKE